MIEEGSKIVFPKELFWIYGHNVKKYMKAMAKPSKIRQNTWILDQAEECE